MTEGRKKKIESLKVRIQKIKNTLRLSKKKNDGQSGLMTVPFKTWSGRHRALEER